MARNLARMIAAGASAHSDHGRDILEVFHHTAAGETTAYQITDVEKLKRLAKEYGVKVDGRKTLEIARDLAWEMMEDYGMRKSSLTFVERAPKARRRAVGEAGHHPAGHRPGECRIAAPHAHGRGQ